MIHILGALGIAAFLAVLIAIADHAGIRRRFSQAARPLSKAGPWLVAAVLTWAARGRSPSRAAKAAATPSHPSVRTPGLPRDGSPLDDYEKRALDAITRKFTWDHEPQRRVPQQKERS